MRAEIDQIATEIRADTKSGATTLAARGLDALDLLASDLPKDNNRAEKSVVELVRTLDGLRRSMGAIGTQAVLTASRAQRLVAGGLSWSTALNRAVTKERETLGQANRTIAVLAKRELGGGGDFVSCSWSTTAQQVLVALEPELVRMGEGHRMSDGMRGAKWLAARGIDVDVIPDGALPTVVDGSRAVLIGADHVLSDGSVVNRCSSFSLALAAKWFEVPFIVVCQRIKLGGGQEATIEKSPDLFRRLPAGVTGSAPIFDVTPAGIITRVITESGSMTATEAGEVGRGIERLREQILGS